MVRVPNSAESAVLSFVRAVGDDRVFGAFNFSDEDRTVTLGDGPQVGAVARRLHRRDARAGAGTGVPPAGVGLPGPRRRLTRQPARSKEHSVRAARNALSIGRTTSGHESGRGHVESGARRRPRSARMEVRTRRCSPVPAGTSVPRRRPTPRSVGDGVSRSPPTRGHPRRRAPVRPVAAAWLHPRRPASGGDGDRAAVGHEPPVEAGEGRRVDDLVGRRPSR